MTGDEFRNSILARWNLNEPETVLLDQAAGTLNVIAEVEASDLSLRDKARELRGQRLAFARLVSQLALPDEAGLPVASITHQRARKAAQARWAAKAAERG